MSDEKNRLSNCCRAALEVQSGGEGTAYYKCLKCEKPCDPLMEEAPAAEGAVDGISDLKLYSTEDILKELAERAPTAVIGMTRPAKTDSSKMTYKLRWWGDPFKAQGLCEAISHEITRERFLNESSINTDDF